MDKYYTPDISELHTGFIYEEFVGEKWVIAVIYDDFSTSQSYEATFIDMIYLLENNKLRVKYLDRSDIESLGFTFIEGDKPDSSEDSSYYSWTFQKKAYPNLDIKSLEDKVIQLRYTINGLYNDEKLVEHAHNVSIRYKNKIESFEDKRYSTYIFTGIIKNKSELVKLLKQLNIE